MDMNKVIQVTFFLLGEIKVMLDDKPAPPAPPLPSVPEIEQRIKDISDFLED